MLLFELRELARQLVDQLAVGQARDRLTHGLLGRDELLEELAGLARVDAWRQRGPARRGRRSSGDWMPARLRSSSGRRLGLGLRVRARLDFGRPPLRLGLMLAPLGLGEQPLERALLDLQQDPRPIVLVGDEPGLEVLQAKANRRRAAADGQQGRHVPLDLIVVTRGRDPVDAVEIAFERHLEHLDGLLERVEGRHRDPLLVSRRGQPGGC